MKKICELLELLFLIDEEDENCDLFECPHNIFWKELGLACHQTETSRRLKNCMLMVREPIPIGKIVEMYGLPKTKLKKLCPSETERYLNRWAEAVRAVPHPSHALRRGNVPS